MSKNTAIEIFLRVRPTKRPFDGFAIRPEDNIVDIHIPKDSGGYINNTREDFSFKFNGIMPMETKQDQVFDIVAKDVIDSGLDGYNGTIFAYGQTGSGKTFTMTGGVEKYDDRGIIPRTLSYVFSEAKRRSDSKFEVSISYLEIYDDKGYDLLDANHSTKKLEDLPKVIPRETGDERIMLSGLSLHRADAEEDALNLLFIGDTNRVVSETPMNDASTRSHCIFIIQLEVCKGGSDVKTVSRVHLVDLSGSERVGKTGVTDLLLKEARFINLSLHHLARVIVCLNQKARGEQIHIPYRESLMTLVLRDSLGGNCKTRMVATVSTDKSDLDESISTCRFAARVALINNSVLKNEAYDPSIIIERLKRENAELRAELAMLKGGDNKDSLDPEDIAECKTITEEYIKNKDPSAKIILSDRLKIHECFYHFKHLYNDLLKRHGSGNTSMTQGKLKEALGMDNGSRGPPTNNTSNEDTLRLSDEIRKLKLQVQHRDNEILILLNLINKHKAQTGEENPLIPVNRNDISHDKGRNLDVRQGGLDTSIIITNAEEGQTYRAITFPPIQLGEEQKNSRVKEAYNAKPVNYKETAQEEAARKISMQQGGLDSTPKRGDRNSSMSGSTRGSDASFSENTTNLNSTKEMTEVNSFLAAPLNMTAEQLMDRANCFELFRKSYRKNEALEENKQLLQVKYARGKELGQVVNNSRNRINQLKNQIEELRKENALQGLVNNENDVMKHPEEDKLAAEIEKHKLNYKNGFQELKDLKAEITRIELILERNRDQLQKDFEKWLSVMLSQRSGGSTMLGSQNDVSSRSNYRPPSPGSAKLSMMSSKTAAPGPSADVERNLAAFYKARDEIYTQNKR